MSILDTVMSSHAAQALRDFDPHGSALRFLAKLPERERQILQSRYGLQEAETQTLEVIGKKLGLTRERVRQLEKAALKRLCSEPLPGDLKSGTDLIFQILEEHGSIMREDRLVQALLPVEEQKNMLARNAVIFILHLAPNFNLLRESEAAHRAWFLNGFDREAFERISKTALRILDEAGAAMPAEKFFAALREPLGADFAPLPEQALESALSINTALDRNPFGQWGRRQWSAIRPHDVGDKAYLTLLHRGEPAHYAEITELINKNVFDERVAHRETVHNELIKDDRFVLVGRGIYALREWGYKPGVVADVIAEILRTAGKPLAREEIIAEVGKQRRVKRNTIIVGLSNRSRFRKTADGKYLNVQ